MKAKTDRRARLGKRFGSPRSGNPLRKVFAKRFQEWRARNGLLLKEIARDLDVSISIVAEWENGHRFPSVDHLYAIAQRTGIPAWRFLRP
jgi:transcriptional regulator with XRE-family HTH domain